MWPLERVGGSNPLLYDQVFVKEPGTSSPTPWHQDQPYWPIKGWQIMSFWAALDPVTEESGGIQFIRNEAASASSVVRRMSPIYSSAILRGKSRIEIVAARSHL